MKWALSLFRMRGGLPPLREFPSLLLKCVVWGVVTGPLWAAFFTSFQNPAGALQIFINPVELFWSSVCGVIFTICFFIACGLGNAWLRQLLNGYPSGIIRAVYVIYNAVAASLACAASFQIIMHLPIGIRIDIPFFPQVILADGLIGAVLALFIGAFMKLKLQVEQQELAVRELALAASQAQSRALQSQINPHFFFNTLNTISALIDDDAATAKQMIGRLADLFRYTLGCSNADAVTLSEEVEFVRDYLSIERARFRKRLNVEMPSGELPNVRVPGLVLQPLVENAIKHGIAPLIDGGSVQVQVTPCNSGVRVSVRNTTDEQQLPELAAMFRPGHALDNVRARLRLFTGESEPLRVCRGDGWVEFSFEARLS